jgi:hypothetical protein
MTRSAAIVMIVASILTVTGCAEKEDVALPNLPPETYVAVADSIRHATVYTQTITWWGSDVDGEIIGYEYRWHMDPAEPGCPMDTLWHFTEARSDTFDLPVTNETSTHLFEVRAYDDNLAWDDTPCSLSVPVINTPPEIHIRKPEAVPDTTFPSLLVEVEFSDMEGDETVASVLAWLDSDDPEILEFAPEDATISLGAEAFAGSYGERTLSVVAVDTGCDTSRVDSLTWYVTPPTGRVLLIDDLSSAAGAAERISDRFYRAGLDSCEGTYSVLDLEGFGGTTGAHNFPELFSQFDLVIWYTGHLLTQEPLALAGLEGTITEYVAGGGNFLLQSLRAVGSGGVFEDSLVLDPFGIDRLYLNQGSTNWDCRKWHIQGTAEAGLDSLKFQSNTPGVEFIKPMAEALPLYHLLPGTAGPQTFYMGILNSWQAGRAALLTFPLGRCNGYGNGRSEYCKIVELMLYWEKP